MSSIRSIHNSIYVVDTTLKVRGSAYRLHGLASAQVMDNQRQTGGITSKGAAWMRPRVVVCLLWIASSLAFGQNPVGPSHGSDRINRCGFTF